MLRDLILAKFVRDLGQVSSDKHQRERKQCQDLLACLTNAIHTDGIFGKTSSGKDISFIWNQAGDVNDFTRAFLLAGALVVCVVQTHGNARATRLTIKSCGINLAPRFILCDRLVEWKFERDRGASPCKHNWGHGHW